MIGGFKAGESVVGGRDDSTTVIGPVGQFKVGEGKLGEALSITIMTSTETVTAPGQSMSVDSPVSFGVSDAAVASTGTPISTLSPADVAATEAVLTAAGQSISADVALSLTGTSLNTQSPTVTLDAVVETAASEASLSSVELTFSTKRDAKLAAEAVSATDGAISLDVALSVTDTAVSTSEFGVSTERTALPSTASPTATGPSVGSKRGATVTAEAVSSVDELISLDMAMAVANGVVSTAELGASTRRTALPSTASPTAVEPTLNTRRGASLGPEALSAGGLSTDVESVYSATVGVSSVSADSRPITVNSPFDLSASPGVASTEQGSVTMFPAYLEVTAGNVSTDGLTPAITIGLSMAATVETLSTITPEAVVQIVAGRRSATTGVSTQGVITSANPTSVTLDGPNGVFVSTPNVADVPSTDLGARVTGPRGTEVDGSKTAAQPDGTPNEAVTDGSNDTDTVSGERSAQTDGGNDT